MQMANKAHKQMLNITSHQGDANPNYNKYLSPHTHQNGIKKTEKNKCW